MQAGLLTLATLVLTGCSREGGTPTPTPRPRQQRVVIDFPAELRAEDPTVNTFVEQVIQTCVDRDYEAFRLLWRVEEKPMSQQEFIRGWEAAEEVRILQLQKWRTREGELLYAAKGQVKLNPNEVPKPELEVVLLIVKENGQWRLARAPRGTARKMQERADAATSGLAASNGLSTDTNGAGAD